MQVDPIKLMLKAPGIKRLKLIRDEPLSNLAFKFKLRRYTMEVVRAGRALPELVSKSVNRRASEGGGGVAGVAAAAAEAAGASG